MSDTTNGKFQQELFAALESRLSGKEDFDTFVENLAAAYASPPSARYNDDFFFDIIKPALVALIRFKDDTAKELRHYKDFISEKGCASEGTDYAVEILENTLDGIDDILGSYDVQPFRCEDTKFNPRRQNVVKKLTAEHTDQVKTVAESLSDGYERRGYVISKEKVAAYSAQSKTGEDA